MKKIDRESLKVLASHLMFELNETELNDIESSSKNFMYYLDLLNNIDTNDVEEMTYPIEEERHTLREDVISHTITREEAFLNAPKTEGEYFEVVQVIEK